MTMTNPTTCTASGGEKEREAVVRWLARYGDEINRAIANTRDGPLKTSAMGEFAAAVTIRQAIERGLHTQPPASKEGRK